MNRGNPGKLRMPLGVTLFRHPRHRVEQHYGHSAAAHRDRYAQRRPAQPRVMVGADREPDTAPRMQVQLLVS